MEDQIKKLLSQVIHPESGKDLISGNFLESIKINEERVVITLAFPKGRDPFAIKIKKSVERMMGDSFPASITTVVIKEGVTVKPKKEPQKSTTTKIGKVIAIASGKGGVGKSTVTANLAVSLAARGFRVGLLDGDIYGPSMAKMFGVEDYLPDARVEDGVECIVPAEVMGVKLISIALFIKPDDALLWRGTMACSALRQLIHQTLWGELDFLLIDLPPGTGDIYISLMSELKPSAAIIVSTPQQIALADVRRGVEMFRHKDVNVPIAGIVENMAFFTPAELPDNKYYIFGKGGAREYATKVDVPFLGEVPIIQSIMEGADGGKPASLVDSKVREYYDGIVDNLIVNIC
ncbi:MAG: Mrp/NBP35 family ATP-binding protein [Rikenellaceae bacterium]